MLQAGANLDGPIKHPHTGKVMYCSAVAASEASHFFARLQCFARLAGICWDWWRSSEHAYAGTGGGAVSMRMLGLVEEQ